jgi:hypothetical protein
MPFGACVERRIAVDSYGLISAKARAISLRLSFHLTLLRIPLPPPISRIFYALHKRSTFFKISTTEASALFIESGVSKESWDGYLFFPAFNVRL